MSRRVLIVESSLAVRGIAESLLRQHGFEVVAADSVDAAKAILNDTKIDLLLVASDIGDSQGQKFYEFVGGEASTAAIPLLVFHDPTLGEDLPFPPEAIINKPFTPNDFMATINAFTGGGESQAASESSPFDGSDFEDDIIDAALGLDKIDIHDSEVIGNDTGVFRIHNKKTTTGSMIGYQFVEKPDDTTTFKKKIDEINVPADSSKPADSASPSANQGQSTEAGHEFLGHDTNKLNVRPAQNMSESSKIEIVTDQYGIALPEESLQPETDDDVHDYNWFINELKNEASGTDTAPPAPPASGPIDITSPSETLNPSAPPPASEQTPSQQSGEQDEVVNEFISEFKKEMEKISDDIEPSLPVTNIAPATVTDSGHELPWNECIADASEPEMRRFSGELRREIASQIAQKIMDRIDDKTIYAIIKEVVEGIVHRQLSKGD